MPSFDIVSEVDNQELDNAVNQARKELATRFDFKGVAAEIVAEKDKITLTAQDAGHLRGLRDILIGKLSKRGVDLRNIQQDEPAISSVGHVHVVFGVHCNAMGSAELSRLISGFSPRLDPVPILVNLRDPRVDIAIANVCVACLVPRHVCHLPEHSIYRRQRWVRVR